MRAIKQALDLQWETPAEALGDLPTAFVTGLVLTMAHTARFLPWEGLRARLKDLLGAPVEKKSWHKVRMAWPGGKLPLTVTATKRRVRIKAHGRVTPRRLERLMEALAEVPNLERVRLRGSTVRYPAGTPSTDRPDGAASSRRSG